MGYSFLFISTTLLFNKYVKIMEWRSFLLAVFSNSLAALWRKAVTQTGNLRIWKLHLCTFSGRLSLWSWMPAFGSWLYGSLTLMCSWLLDLPEFHFPLM